MCVCEYVFVQACRRGCRYTQIHMQILTEVEEEEFPLEGAVVRDAEEDEDGDDRHVPRPEILFSLLVFVGWFSRGLWWCLRGRVALVLLLSSDTDMRTTRPQTTHRPDPSTHKTHKKHTKNTCLGKADEDELRHNQVQDAQGKGRRVDASRHARLPDVVSHALCLVPRDGLADAALHLGAEQRRQLPPLVGDAGLWGVVLGCLRMEWS